MVRNLPMTMASLTTLQSRGWYVKMGKSEVQA